MSEKTSQQRNETSVSYLVTERFRHVGDAKPPVVVSNIEPRSLLADAREIAALVGMPELLGAVGFTVNTRTRRCACILHGGSNPSAFSWTEGGLWKCHGCGAGGDRIALAQAVRHCGFREAVEFLAGLAGVEYRARRISREEVARIQARRERAEAAAWRVRDRIVRLQSRCARALRAVEGLQRAIGERLETETTSSNSAEQLWEMLARLAPVSGSLFAIWDYMGRADMEARIRFVLGSGARRCAVLFGDDSNESIAA